MTSCAASLADAIPRSQEPATPNMSVTAWRMAAASVLGGLCVPTSTVSAPKTREQPSSIQPGLFHHEGFISDYEGLRLSSRTPVLASAPITTLAHTDVSLCSRGHDPCRNGVLAGYPAPRASDRCMAARTSRPSVRLEGLDDAVQLRAVLGLAAAELVEPVAWRR